MTIEQWSSFLGWNLVLNFGLLLFWAGMLLFARGFVLRLHGRWFRLDEAGFDRLHYAAMAGYKIAIFIFNLMPWLALQLMR